MKTRGTLITAFALLSAVAGCQKASGPGVQVHVRAEPKQGYEPPPPEDTGYLPADDPAVRQGHDHAYHLIDYRKLGVVVCLEPLDGQAVEQTAPAVADIEVGERVKAKGDVYVTQAGPVTFRNNGSTAQTVLLRSVLGVDPLEIVPGGAAAQAFDGRVPRGPVEVSRDEDDDEILAYVYLAPSPLVRVARGGERVTFAPLTPGKYRVTTWHPILPGSSRVVDVAPARMSKLTVTVGVNSLPKPSR